jgi:hypothetical protein
VCQSIQLQLAKSANEWANSASTVACRYLLNVQVYMKWYNEFSFWSIKNILEGHFQLSQIYSMVSQVDSKIDQGRNNLGSVHCILFYVSLQTCGSVWGSITFLSSMVNQKIIPVAFGKDTFTKYNFIISTHNLS